MEIVFSIGSAVLVVVLTQCWQQYRHNDLRKDRADERKEERVEESQRRQREAIHAFLNAIQEIVNRHRTEWSNIVSQVDDEQRRKNRGWAENVNLREGIKIEIDKLSLLVTDLEVRACIADMRKAAGRIRVEPEEENWSVPNLPVLDGEFLVARDVLVSKANEKFCPPPERFWPFLT